MDQMNENSERLRALKAENKDLQNKLDTMATIITPPPRFGHIRYEVNNPSSAPWQATPVTSYCTLRTSSGCYGSGRDKPVAFLKCGNHHPYNRTCNQRAHDTGREHDRYGSLDLHFI
ncbi:hypothetical protein ACOSP7_006211 [Xanthoceras sorbifolium]